MIASPCRNCPRRYQPKEGCIKDCSILQAIQDMQQSSMKDILISGIDYAEENRFTLSLTKTNNLSISN